MAPPAPGSRARSNPPLPPPSVLPPCRPWIALTLGLALLVAPDASAVEMVLGGMTYVSSQAGRPDMVLDAEHARVVHDGNVAYLDGVRLDAAGDAGGSSLVMTCEHAQLDLATSDFSAMGDVRGRTADGHRFRTEAATFRHARGVLESDVAVDIVDPTGTRLEGQGFHYDIRSQRMRMRNAVVSEIPGGVQPMNPGESSQ